MQGYFLTEDERERRRRFPEDIPPRDVSDYFTLSETDRRRVKQQRGFHNRLGFALPLCALCEFLFFANKGTIRRKRDEDITHLSPTRFEHLNPYGKYTFAIDHLTKSFTCVSYARQQGRLSDVFFTFLHGLACTTSTRVIAVRTGQK